MKCNLSVFLGTWVDHDTNATWKKVWYESSEIWNRSFLQTPVETCSWKDTKKRRGLFSRQEQALWSDRFGWRWNFPFCTEIMQKYVGRQGIGLQWKNAVIDPLKVCQWKSTKLLYASHTKMMKEDPENCTGWKHKRLLAQSSERVGHDGYTQVQNHHLHFDTNETPHGTQTRTWRTRHAEIWVLETALFTRVKTGLQCKFVESLMSLANELNGEFAQGRKYQDTIGKIQKIMHSWWKRGTVTPTSVIEDFVKQSVNGVTRPRSRPLGRHWRTGSRGNWYP